MHYLFSPETDDAIDCKLGSDVLRVMFAARKSVFVDLLKWDVPVLFDRFEIDEFDHPFAVYHVLASDDGEHLASARLLPTIRPHILDTLYGELCDGKPPRGPDIFEITRFCLDRSMRAAQRREVRDTLIRHLVDYALSRRITAFTAIAEGNWYRKVAKFGWQCEPLGKPQIIDGRELWAIHIRIDADTPARLAACGIAAPTELPRAA